MQWYNTMVFFCSMSIDVNVKVACLPLWYSRFKFIDSMNPWYLAVSVHCSHHSDSYSIVDHLPRCQLATWTSGFRRNFQRMEVVWISPGSVQFVFQETWELGWHPQWNGWVLWLWECKAGELHCAAVHGVMHPVDPHCNLGRYGWRGPQNVGDGDSETLCSLSCLCKCMSWLWSQLKSETLCHMLLTWLVHDLHLFNLITHSFTHCLPIKT